MLPSILFQLGTVILNNDCLYLKRYVGCLKWLISESCIFISDFSSVNTLPEFLCTFVLPVWNVLNTHAQCKVLLHYFLSHISLLYRPSTMCDPGTFWAWGNSPASEEKASLSRWLRWSTNMNTELVGRLPGETTLQEGTRKYQHH